MADVVVSGSVEPDGSAWEVLPHALRRMREMGVGEDEVLAAVADPAMSYPCSARYPGRRILVQGRLAVCVAGNLLITILWRGRESRDAA